MQLGKPFKDLENEAVKNVSVINGRTKEVSSNNIVYEMGRVPLALSDNFLADLILSS